MASAERHKFEYDSESEIVEDYKKIVLPNLAVAADYLFETLFEEAVTQVAFQMHFENKLSVSLDRIFIQFSSRIAMSNFSYFQDIFGSPQNHEDSKKNSSLSHNDYSAGSSNKFLNCKCLNCEKTVSANKYASHLENCLGIGRTSSRIASRKKTTNSSYYDYPDYDDDPEGDANWSAKEKTKKKPQGSNGRNGKNKSRF